MNNRQIIRNVIAKKLEEYKGKLIKEMDIVSEKDKKEMVKEINIIIKEIQENIKYKEKSEDLQARLNHLCSLEDCDEEFEL